MKRSIRRSTAPVFLFAWVLISCQGTSGDLSTPTETPLPEASVTVTAAPSEIPPTQTSIPNPPTEIATTPTPTQSPEPSATTGPECIVLQSLNFRSGPGVAYRPPVSALPAGTQLTPLGFNPVGVPGGSWVQVEIETANQIGWVSAGEQFVECNVDLTTFPSVDVSPPPPPAPPSVNASTPDGTVPENWKWDDIFDPNFLVQMKVYDEGNGGTKDGDGMVQVNFQVIDENGNQVWERAENTAAYCIFAGGEPACNPWVIEDYFYKWGTGGPQVVEGNYTLLITAESSVGEFGNWNYDIFIDLPY